MDVFATVIVTAATQQDAQAIAGEGAFQVGCSSTGQPPATHYIASGYMPEDQVEALTALPDADVSGDDPFVALEEAGLQMISPNDQLPDETELEIAEG